MKKILLLLAVLLNAHLQASQPTTQDIIQLPKALASSSGLHNIGTGVLLLMSRYIFGTIEENNFVSVQKARSRDHLDFTRSVLWIVPHKSSGYLPSHQNIEIDETFWSPYQDWFSPHNQTIQKDPGGWYCEVSFLGKLCLIAPIPSSQSKKLCFVPLSTQLNSPNEEEHYYELNRNNRYYQISYLISTSQISSEASLCTLTPVAVLLKYLKEEAIIKPSKKNYNKLPYFTSEEQAIEEDVEEQIIPEEVDESEEGHIVSDEEVVSGGEEEEDDEEISIYD